LSKKRNIKPTAMEVINMGAKIVDRKKPRKKVTLLYKRSAKQNPNMDSKLTATNTKTTVFRIAVQNDLLDITLI